MTRSKPRILRIRLRRREDGQAMVEFALVLPVLLLILLAIMKFGIMFENYLTLTDAVRSGARQLALARGSTMTNVCSATVAGGAEYQAINAASGAITLTSSSFPTPTFSGGETCTNPSAWVQGDQATLKANYPCDLTVLGINFFSGCTLSASATEAIE